MSDDDSSTAFAIRLVKAQALREAAATLKTQPERVYTYQGDELVADWLEARAAELEQR
jgi:hypothetical protein